MKLLWLAKRCPWPPRSGERLRTARLVEGLAQLGHDVTLACVGSGAAFSPEYIRMVELPEPSSWGQVRSLLAGVVTGRAPQTWEIGAGQRERVKSLLQTERYELVVASQLYGWGLVPNGWRDRTVFDTHNYEASRFERIAARSPSLRKRLTARLLLRRVRNGERVACESAAQVWVASDDEGPQFEALRPVGTVIVRNGCTISDAPAVRPTGGSFLFLGSLSYSTNQEALNWMCREVLPHLSRPTRLRVVGSGADPKYAAELKGFRCLEFIGEVDDVQPYLAEAAALLVPVFTGAGSRMKILEAFASAVPVVSTALGAEGLGATASVHYIEANDSQQWIAALSQWNHADATSMALRAQEYVRSRFQWHVIADVASRALHSLSVGA